MMYFVRCPTRNEHNCAFVTRKRRKHYFILLRAIRVCVVSLIWWKQNQFTVHAVHMLLMVDGGAWKSVGVCCRALAIRMKQCALTSNMFECRERRTAFTLQIGAWRNYVFVRGLFFSRVFCWTQSTAEHSKYRQRNALKAVLHTERVTEGRHGAHNKHTAVS